MFKKSLYVLALSYLALAGAQAQESSTKEVQKGVRGDYVVQDYSSLYGMPGFSKELLAMHFQLYAGYVKNSNWLMAKLQKMLEDGQASSYEYGALKRRFGWEFDGMRLHELYFENLGGKKAIEQDSSLFARIEKDFGSYELWEKDFRATGAIRGIGWVVLYEDPLTGSLVNAWINEHDLGHLAGGTPLLVMDVFEHAYITQYGLDRAKYIEAFFQNIRWDVVQKRL